MNVVQWGVKLSGSAWEKEEETGFEDVWEVAKCEVKAPTWGI